MGWGDHIKSFSALFKPMLNYCRILKTSSLIFLKASMQSRCIFGGPRQLRNNWRISTLLNPLINPGLRIFLENPSDSNDETYCPLHLCKKLEISLEPFSKKAKIKHTSFGHLIPLFQDEEFFQENHLAQTMGPIFPHTYAKIREILKVIAEKRIKK